MGTCHRTHHHVHKLRGQRTAWSGWFFSFPPVSPGKELSLSAMVGRHLYPMSYFTISHDKEFCLENFSVLKQERHKGAGIFLLFSQVLLSAKDKDPWFWMQTLVWTKCNRSSTSWGKGIDTDMNLLADLLCSIKSTFFVCDYIVSQESILWIRKKVP